MNHGGCNHARHRQNQKYLGTHSDHVSTSSANDSWDVGLSNREISSNEFHSEIMDTGQPLPSALKTGPPLIAQLRSFRPQGSESADGFRTLGVSPKLSTARPNSSQRPTALLPGSSPCQGVRRELGWHKSPALMMLQVGHRQTVAALRTCPNQPLSEQGFPESSVVAWWAKLVFGQSRGPGRACHGARRRRRCSPAVRPPPAGPRNQECDSW